MSTTSRTRSGAAPRRSFRLIALVASLTLAAAGLIGIGLAPAASAMPPNQCPTDTATVNWELVGDTCVGTSYTDSIESAPIYSCPAPYVPVEGDASKCTWTPTPQWDDEKDEWTCDSYERSEEDGVEDESVSVSRDRHKDKHFTHHTHKKKCGEDEEVAPDPCDPIIVPANVRYTYSCPPVDAQAATLAQIGPDTKCPVIQYQDPTCPKGYELEKWVDSVSASNEDNYVEDSIVILPEGPNCVPIPENPTSFSASASAEAGATLCVNNATVGVGAIGSGSAESTESEADAQTKAQAIANANALANLDSAKGQYPGAGQTECPPGVVQSTNVAASAITTAAPAAATAAKPAKRPVKVPAPGSVSAGVAGSASSGSAAAGVPTSATVPSAVPAGDGSQAPALPMWALALIAVGVVGAAAAGKQMVGAKK